MDFPWRPEADNGLLGGAPAPPDPPTFFVGLRPPWKILGKSMDRSRVFGNPDFGKKSRFGNKLAVFAKF